MGIVQRFYSSEATTTPLPGPLWEIETRVTWVFIFHNARSLQLLFVSNDSLVLGFIETRVVVFVFIWEGDSGF